MSRCITTDNQGKAWVGSESGELVCVEQVSTNFEQVCVDAVGALICHAKHGVPPRLPYAHGRRSLDGEVQGGMMWLEMRASYRWQSSLRTRSLGDALPYGEMHCSSGNALSRKHTFQSCQLPVEEQIARECHDCLCCPRCQNWEECSRRWQSRLQHPRPQRPRLEQPGHLHLSLAAGVEHGRRIQRLS